MRTDIHFLWRNILPIAFISIAVGVLSAAVSFALPLEYRADAQLLVIAPTPVGGDQYAALKSAERIGENLAQVVETNDFFQKVTAQDESLDTSAFQDVSERVKRKRWQKAVDASVGYGTSVLTLSLYHKNPAMAEAFATAAVRALVRDGSGYVGGSVAIKVINAPVVARFPARPNFLLNGLVGLLVGSLLGVLYVVRQEKKKMSHL